MKWAFSVALLCALAHAQLTTAADSCSGRCDDPLDTAYDCQCNYACETYGDCCSDYHGLCLGAEYSCNARCDESYNSANPCHCNDLCKSHNNCCNDYDDYCVGTDPATTCSNGRCGEAYNSANPCHCNDLCKNYGNCCSDYDDFCAVTDPNSSCSSRCNDLFDANMPCQCNSDCATYGDCCSDHSTVCSGSGGGGSGGDLSALAQSLWDSDVNRLEGADLGFNKQAYLSDYSQRNDQSSEPLFTSVNMAKLDTGTWPSFIALLDNYNRFTGTGDTTTVDETFEIETFLDEVFATQVMSLTTTWMTDNGYFETEADFRAYVKNIWFTLYTRSGGTIDSSGFEHTFVGEVKNGKVSGYHNWLAFHLDEEAGKVNYYGYTSDNEPNQILMQFNLNEGSGVYWKELASIIAGSSPEFELAMFTSCFVKNPNALSTFTINGFTQKIQTWDYTGGYIGSTYFSV